MSPQWWWLVESAALPEALERSLGLIMALLEVGILAVSTAKNTAASPCLPGTADSTSICSS